MPDRDKVISHFLDAIEAGSKGNRWRFVRVDIIEDAIELLKEQEPVRPMNGMLCGECGCAIYPGADYCYKCGRKVKRDDS